MTRSIWRFKPLRPVQSPLYRATAELSAPSEEDRGRQKSKSQDEYFQRANAAGSSQIVEQCMHFCFGCKGSFTTTYIFHFKLTSVFISSHLETV